MNDPLKWYLNTAYYLQLASSQFYESIYVTKFLLLQEKYIIHLIHVDLQSIYIDLIIFLYISVFFFISTGCKMEKVL